MSTDGHHIEVGCSDEEVVVVVHGKGNLFNSYPLQDFLATALENDVSGVVINMQDCDAVDSTFMGVMAGLSEKLSGRGMAKLRVVNASEDVTNILEEMGVRHLVELSEGEINCGDAAELLDEPDLSKLQRGEHMLEAHERLMQLSEENHRRFESLIATLQANIKKHRNEG